MCEMAVREGLKIFCGRVDFICPLYQGSLNFIIYFYFSILKELIIYVSYCFISIDNSLLVMKCYSSLVVSGFSRNEFNSYIFLLISVVYVFLFDVKIKGD